MHSRSFASSVLVLAHSLSSNTPSPEYEILKPGMYMWRRLADKDQSFTVSFYGFYAVVSFNIADGLGDVEGALWVRVGFLEPKEQPRLSRDGQNVITLEDIQEGAEVTVKYGTEWCRTILYILWKRDVISIKYSY